MNKEEFLTLIDKNKNQVFLFSSPIPLPFSFARHMWLVTAKKGKVHRWDVWQIKNQNKTSWDHIHRDVVKPWQGMRMSPFGRGKNKNRKRFKCSLEGSVEGKQALAIINYLEKIQTSYPFRNEYSFVPGPNSNTFVGYILRQFPKVKLKQPWNAFGKNFRI